MYIGKYSGLTEKKVSIITVDSWLPDSENLWCNEISANVSITVSGKVS